MREGPIVCDAGPLIALSLIDQLGLLCSLYHRVLVPRAVLEEGTAGGMEVKGSAGILVAAKRAGVIAEVRPLLDSMARKGYFLSQRLVERATQEAGEAASPPEAGSPQGS